MIATRAGKTMVIGAALFVATLLVSVSMIAQAQEDEAKGKVLAISTRDCGDGTPGMGADSWLIENEKPESLKAKTSAGKWAPFLLIRTNPRVNNLGILRFDLSQMQGKKAQSVTLKLWNRGHNTNTMTVMGLTDNIQGENKGGNQSVNDHDLDIHDEFWSEKLVDRESAPGMLPADLNPETTEWAEGAVTELGTFQNVKTPDTEVTFSSQALADFINADTNQVVTLYLVGGGNSSGYETKEADGKPAPTLEITLQP